MYLQYMQVTNFYFILNPIYSPLWRAICEGVNKYGNGWAPKFPSHVEGNYMEAGN
jgi:hypothetical protein